MKRTIAISTQAYRVMLRAYPGAFRAEYGDEMTLVFRDCLRECAQDGGLWGLLIVWLHTLLDWFTTVIKQHLLKHQIRSANMIDTTEFDSQLVSSMEFMSKALRSGYSVKQAFDMLARKAPQPTADAFRGVVNSIENGEDWVSALDSMREQVPSPHLDHIIAVMHRQLEEGGNLADRLDSLNDSLRGTLGDDGWSDSHTDFKSTGDISNAV